MKRLLIAAGIVLSFVVIATAGPLTLEWSPAPGATSYDVEQSVDNGVTWTLVTNVLPTACTGAPALCTVSVTTPTTGRPQYIVSARNAGGKSRPQIGIVATDAIVNPAAPPPPVDGTAGSR